MLPRGDAGAGGLGGEGEGGSQVDVTVGDAYVIGPGDDASVVGERPAELVEFNSAATSGRSPTAGIDVRRVPV